jgi:hypothetical protein
LSLPSRSRLKHTKSKWRSNTNPFLKMPWNLNMINLSEYEFCLYNTIFIWAPFHRDTCSRRYFSKNVSAKEPSLKKASEGSELCGCPDILWQTIPQMRPYMLQAGAKLLPPQ